MVLPLGLGCENVAWNSSVALFSPVRWGLASSVCPVWVCSSVTPGPGMGVGTVRVIPVVLCRRWFSVRLCPVGIINYPLNCPVWV